MRRITLLVGTVGLLAAGAFGAIACGSDDVTVPDATDSGTTNTSSGTSGAGTSSGGTSGANGTSSGGTSGAPTDGGTSGTTSSGELPPNPHQYTCGAVTCDGGQGVGPGSGGSENVCCVSADPTKTKCAAEFQCNNQGTNGNLRVFCDETADCHDDRDICCYFKQGNQNPSFETQCARPNECRTFTNNGGGPPAVVPRPQLCHSSAECGDAGACNEKTCDGFKIHVCGSPAGCTN